MPMIKKSGNIIAKNAMMSFVRILKDIACSRYLVRRCLDYINSLISLNCKLLKNLFRNIIFSNLHNLLSILSVSFGETCPFASDLNFSSTSLSVMEFLGWPLGYATFFKNCLPSFVIILIILGIASGYCAVNPLFLTTLTF